MGNICNIPEEKRAEAELGERVEKGVDEVKGPEVPGSDPGD